MAVAGSLVGNGAVQVLQNFDEFCAQSGGHAGHKGIMQPLLPGHQGLDNTQSGLQLAQVGDLHAGNRVVAGQRVSGFGEGHSLALAVLRNRIIDGGFGQAVNGIVTAKNSIKKCHGISSYCSSRSKIALIFRISSIAVGLQS